jgi:multidrug efflux pump subunit AcrA (membrane-fusion protein)
MSRAAVLRIGGRGAAMNVFGSMSRRSGSWPRAPQEETKADTEVADQVAAVTQADIKARVEAYGMVEPEPAKAGQPGGGARLAAPITGIVIAMHVVEGQSVRAGEVVVELDDRIAQAAVDKARHAFARQVADRQARLITFGGTTLQACTA